MYVCVYVCLSHNMIENDLLLFKMKDEQPLLKEDK